MAVLVYCGEVILSHAGVPGINACLIDLLRTDLLPSLLLRRQLDRGFLVLLGLFWCFLVHGDLLVTISLDETFYYGEPKCGALSIATHDPGMGLWGDPLARQQCIGILREAVAMGV